jgi:branched-chain amino acid transport system ATP-binding protein
MSDALLDVSGLSVGYGRIAVVHEASFAVHDGAVTCLIGNNGAGKTTTLKGLLGQQPPSAGKVVFEGRPIHGLSSHAVARRGISIVPEGRHVFPSLSVLDNLRMGAVVRRGRWSRPDGLDRVFELFPELEPFRAKAAGLLSGGQQQMLVIGRALMSRPRLLILDEPSMGLSPVLVQRIYAALGELKREGVAILLSEQNARLALKLADRAYVLETGRIVEEGEAQALRDSPRVREIYLGG